MKLLRGLGKKYISKKTLKQALELGRILWNEGSGKKYFDKNSDVLM